MNWEPVPCGLPRGMGKNDIYFVLLEKNQPLKHANVSCFEFWICKHRQPAQTALHLRVPSHHIDSEYEDDDAPKGITQILFVHFHQKL